MAGDPAVASGVGREGPGKTVYNRFWRWSSTGTLSALMAQVQAIDELDREVAVDSSIVRAHQHAADLATLLLWL